MYGIYMRDGSYAALIIETHFKNLSPICQPYTYQAVNEIIAPYEHKIYYYLVFEGGSKNQSNATLLFALAAATLEIDRKVKDPDQKVKDYECLLRFCHDIPYCAVSNELVLDYCKKSISNGIVEIKRKKFKDERAAPGYILDLNRLATDQVLELGREFEAEYFKVKNVIDANAVSYMQMAHEIKAVEDAFLMEEKLVAVAMMPDLTMPFDNIKVTMQNDVTARYVRLMKEVLVRREEILASLPLILQQQEAQIREIQQIYNQIKAMSSEDLLSRRLQQLPEDGRFAFLDKYISINTQIAPLAVLQLCVELWGAEFKQAIQQCASIFLSMCYLDDCQTTDENLHKLAIESTDFNDIVHRLVLRRVLAPSLLAKVRSMDMSVARQRILHLEAHHELSVKFLSVFAEEEAWSALSMLEEAGIQDDTSKIQAQMLTDSAFRLMVQRLHAMHMLTNENLKLLEQPEVLFAFNFLYEEKMENSVRIARVLSDADLCAVLDLINSAGLLGRQDGIFLITQHLDEMSTVNGLLELLYKHELCHEVKKLAGADVWLAVLALYKSGNDNKEALSLALQNPRLSLGQRVLEDCGINDDFLNSENSRDGHLTTALAGSYNGAVAGTPNHLLPEKIGAIKAMQNLRDDYSKNLRYQPYMPAINEFNLEAITALIQHDSCCLPKERIQELAEKHLVHRHLVARVVADVVLALSGLGLLVLVGRKLSGRSFFFTNAKTDRQQQFEAALCGPRVIPA